MKYIKKVSVAQLSSNTGTIIDSMNSGDDQHVNAPSINAVKDYVDTVTNYTITPAYTTNTPAYIFKKIGKIFILDIAAIYLASISANTWTNVGTIPSEYVSSVAPLVASCIAFNSNNGNIVGYGRMEIQSTGNIRVKVSAAQTGVGFTANYAWTL